MEVASRQKSPILIYDGDCGFCSYWVRYWEQITGDSVAYHPYQRVAEEFPHITIEQFKSAVQYVAPDGAVASGAKASFLTISNGNGNRFWITLYNKLPGFAYCSEAAYKVISTHRDISYTISKFFWGRNPEPPAYDMLTWFFLRIFGLIFLAAFYSFATQAAGLIGSRGIIPVNELAAAAHTQLGSSAYWQLPMLFWFNSSDIAVQAVCWGGVIVSCLLILNIWPRLCLLALYAMYLSLLYAGQVFMTFQWDLLLLETAMISFFLVRYRVLGIWLLRWLTFRFVFAAGIVKLVSGDPSWWDYTALDYHFLTQPLPTPLAWYAYYSPHWLLAFLTGASVFIEIIIPFLFFCPRRLRQFAAFFVLAMQIGISLTGNYNFFNLTTMLLCLSLFDDAALRAVIPVCLLPSLRQRKAAKPPYQLMNVLAVIFAAGTVFISIVQFNLRFIGYVPAVSAAISSVVGPLQIVNTYGPFAVMTKFRYEIILEGSADGENWVEYNFKYKPGDIYRKPRWNIPFQPRVDWQMWFAALGPVDQSPWLTYFVYRLLQGSPDVIALLQDNPFPDRAPLYIRAWLYDYSYTTSSEYKTSKAWWNRELIRVYFPPVGLNSFTGETNGQSQT